MKNLFDVLISIVIFIMIVSIVLMSLLYIANSFISLDKDCQNKSDSYVVTKYNNITCGEWRVINTTIASNEMAK